MNELDDLKALHAADPSGMLAVLTDFPRQCHAALELGQRWPLPESLEFEQVLVLGMGGSGVTGDLLGALLDIPVFVHRGYTPPPFLLNRKTLAVVISYSGNTEETLSGLDAVLKHDLRPICVSSDGTLAKLAGEKGLPLIEIPGGLQPRAALGYLLLPLLQIFSRLGQFPAEELDGLVPALEEVAARLGPERPEEDNEAKKLAHWLSGDIPVIYGSEGPTTVAAYRWKTQFNENSKQHAFWNVLSELNHNEIVGYTKRELFPQMRIIFLKSEHDHPRNQLRRAILEELFMEWQVPFTEASSPVSGDRLTELLGLIYLGDFVSVYLALLNKVDPTPVMAIEEFKRRMRERK